MWLTDDFGRVRVRASIPNRVNMIYTNDRRGTTVVVVISRRRRNNKVAFADDAVVYVYDCVVPVNYFSVRNELFTARARARVIKHRTATTVEVQLYNNTTARSGPRRRRRQNTHTHTRTPWTEQNRRHVVIITCRPEVDCFSNFFKQNFF